MKEPASFSPWSARAFIFDMDGTLVDNCDYHVQAWQAFSRRHGRMLTEREIVDWMGAQAGYYIRNIVGRDLSAEDIDRLTDEKEALYRTLYAPHAKPLPGLRAFLDAAHAKGVPCAVATGGPRANVDFILDTLRLRADFAAVVDASQYVRSKPDPECFRVAAMRLGVPPADCLVFEDAFKGIEAARAGGMRVAVVVTTNTRSALEKAYPDCIVDTYQDFFPPSPASPAG